MAQQLKKADPFGIQRVTLPKGVLPQQAESLDPSLPIAEDELLIEVESLNIDSSSLRQLLESSGGDLKKVENQLLELVRRRGKLHNPVTGTGGMLVGRVAQVGPAFPVGDKAVKVGDRIASLVSLSLTPLEIRSIRRIHPEALRVEIEGHAILFASGVFAKIPSDIPETVALAALDAAAVPVRTREMVRENETVVVIGGGGKAGILALYEAKQKLGVRTIAIESAHDKIERLAALSFVDDVYHVDARNAVQVMDTVWSATKGRMADVVINVANQPETEMACILACRRRGIVCFFNLATNFARVSLGAEGVGADLDLRIASGYAEGHAQLILDLLRDSPELHRIFTEVYS